jgi:hypothetical protein
MVMQIETLPIGLAPEKNESIHIRARTLLSPSDLASLFQK